MLRGARVRCAPGRCPSLLASDAASLRAPLARGRASTLRPHPGHALVRVLAHAHRACVRAGAPTPEAAGSDLQSESASRHLAGKNRIKGKNLVLGSASMAAHLATRCRIKGNRRSLRRRTSGRTVYAYVGGNPVNAIDPAGLIAYLCQKGKNIGVALPIYFSGGTKADHQRMAGAIEKFWSNSAVGNGYSVSVTVLIQSQPNTASNYVRIVPGNNGSFVLGVGGTYGRWSQTPYNSDNRDYAHEAGHFMGIDHNPSASLMSRTASDISPRVKDIEAMLESKSNISGCGCSP